MTEQFEDFEEKVTLVIEMKISDYELYKEDPMLVLSEQYIAGMVPFGVYQKAAEIFSEGTEFMSSTH